MLPSIQLALSLPQHPKTQLSDCGTIMRKNPKQFNSPDCNYREAFSYELKGHSAPVKSIQFNCDGSLLLSASDDKTIKIWSVADKKFSSTLKGHTNWVRKA